MVLTPVKQLYPFIKLLALISLKLTSQKFCTLSLLADNLREQPSFKEHLVTSSFIYNGTAVFDELYT